MVFRIIQTALYTIFLCISASANNIQVSAPTLTGENRTDGYVYVTFDLSWANSWRGTEANNWDAAWVFVKYRVGTGEWKHAKLHNSGHIVGSGTPATLEVGLRDDKSPFEPTGNPGVGAFIYRSAEGFGTFNTTANKLRWNYTAEGITTGATVEVRVFAIEMVYVREGEFNVGGGGGDNSFFSTTINTPDARVTPSGVGSLGGMAGGYPSGFNDNYDQVVIQPMSSDWPNGYKAFYCMKYEASQQQIVDFYNTLTFDQVNSIRRSLYLYRYKVTNDNPGSITTILPNVACGNLTWDALRTYSDWSCLRPMTELEFEKACRGPLPPIEGEYAWGNTEVVGKHDYTGSYMLSYSGTESEGIIANYEAGKGNSNHRNTNLISEYNHTESGPFRVGIFSSNGTNTGRITSGASYWGIMELSGSLYEQCISLRESSGLNFIGSNGDGIINLSTSVGQLDWPANYGAISRGGSFYDWPHYIRVSNRSSQAEGAFELSGIRAVRSSNTTQ